MPADAASRKARVERKEVYGCRKMVLLGLALVTLLTKRDM